MRDDICVPCLMKNVTAAIIERDGRYLLARRAPGQSLADYWESPGGEIEANETPESLSDQGVKESTEY